MVDIFKENAGILFLSESDKRGGGRVLVTDKKEPTSNLPVQTIIHRYIVNSPKLN